MFHQISSREEKTTLQTSQKNRDLQQIEQILITHLANANQLTTEQLQQQLPELKGFIQGIYFAQQMIQQENESKIYAILQSELEKQQQSQSEIKGMLQKFIQEEETRDRKLFQRVKVIQKVVMFTKRQVQTMMRRIQLIQKYTQPTIYAMLTGSLFGDIIADFIKEVVKTWFGEETFEEIASGINWVLETIDPLYRLYVEGISFLFPMCTPKAATIILLVAASILNLTASIRPRLRKKGLGKK